MLLIQINLKKTRNYVLQDSDPDLDLQQRFGAKPSGKRKLEESPSSTQVENTTIQNESGRRPRKRAATSTRKQRARKGKTTEEADDPPGSEGDRDGETPVVDTSEMVNSMPTRRRSVRTGKKIHYLESDEDEGQLDMEVDDGDDGDSNYTPATPIKEEEIETTTLNDPLGDRDSDTDHPTVTTKSIFDVDSDEEEKAKKPVLQLSFRELNMLDRSLCVVIEPWPALQYQTTPAPSISRAGSMAPPPSRFPAVRRESEASFLSGSSAESGAFGSGLREQTPIPLFLPDHDERGHSSTPAPIRFSSVFSSLETFPESEMRGQENEEDFGMLAFSQVLNNVASDRVAVAEDDDEMDGGALYGDADEIRESIM